MSPVSSTNHRGEFRSRGTDPHVSSRTGGYQGYLGVGDVWSRVPSYRSWTARRKRKGGVRRRPDFDSRLFLYETRRALWEWVVSVPTHGMGLGHGSTSGNDPRSR